MQITKKEIENMVLKILERRLKEILIISAIAMILIAATISLAMR